MIPALAIAHFRARSWLNYTLDPLPFGRDDVDSFLFDTRQGFCEHFAAAFVVTLRAAGVPARVVTGYQGGEINPVDGTFVVRQSDAHAWTEVWLPGKGWHSHRPHRRQRAAAHRQRPRRALPDMDRLPLLVRSDLPWLRTLRDNVWRPSTTAGINGFSGTIRRASRRCFPRWAWPEPTGRHSPPSWQRRVPSWRALLAAWACARRSPADAIDRRLGPLLPASGGHRTPPRNLGRAARLRPPPRPPAPRPGPTVTAIATDYARLRYGPASADPLAKPALSPIHQEFPSPMKTAHARLRLRSPCSPACPRPPSQPRGRALCRPTGGPAIHRRNAAKAMASTRTP
jgi:hypothetical protein